ncbi:hypothetical protein HN385_04105 [archaeon]|jgi:uncharacterized membrane protein|nr:hypothetical protein [archaeon]MBT3451670.1 hypothetical protein [archaeon]MBT6869114.1 hypothetical protein [archaeon]MBT7193357.1 hypothetical protein [archaeon]MBT7380365.1 hypothetical protein [archaeon]
MATKKEVEDGKICALLSYLIIGIIWYFVDDKMKKNQFAKFHTQQSLVLVLFSVIVSILNSILSAIITVIAVVTMGVGSVLMIIPLLISFIPMVFWIMGIVYSLQGKEKELPWIGQYGKKLKI